MVLSSRSGLFAALLLFVLFMASCSGTRYIPEGEHLLNKVEVETDNREINREELMSYVRQRGNTRILGFFKFHMWLYNLSPPDKPNSWLKRSGEAPQIYDEVLAFQSREQIRQYLFNKGYYDASVKFKEDTLRNNKKSNLTYKVATGDPWLVNDVQYEVGDSVMRQLFNESYRPRNLKEAALFDLDMLDRERDHITGFFRDRGYYYFLKPFAFFEADTLKQHGYADLKMLIELPGGTAADSLRIFKPYRLNRFTFKVISSGQESVENDTLRQERNTFIFPKSFHYNPMLFRRLNKMEASEWYHAGNAEKSFEALNRLRQFRFINISFREAEEAPAPAMLDCFVDLSPLSRQSTSFDVEGTNTSGNFGIAGNLNYSHRNLFRGAEILNLKLRGAMERQQAIMKNESFDFNTRELGVEATLIVPRLLIPGNFFPSFGSSLPKTLFTLGYNFQRRPDYTRTISTMRLGYEWMTSEYKRHNLNIFDFNMVDLSRFNPEFINSIFDLYIRGSFTDHLILASNYSFVYNTQSIRIRENYTYLRLSAESSGNFLNLLSHITRAAKTTEIDTTGLKPQIYYKLLDTRYAQYIRGDAEFRKGYMLDKYNSVVGRVFFGIGFPYGNFDVLPFEKKYFTGGANGIRAWQVRSLGPGTYHASQGSYPNQSGDIKLEANLEYRFKLTRFLEGAFFLDAGNVWAINEGPGNRYRPKVRFYLFYFSPRPGVESAGSGTGGL